MWDEFAMLTRDCHIFVDKIEYRNINIEYDDVVPASKIQTADNERWRWKSVHWQLLR